MRPTPAEALSAQAGSTASLTYRTLGDLMSAVAGSVALSSGAPNRHGCIEKERMKRGELRTLAMRASEKLFNEES